MGVNKLHKLCAAFPIMPQPCLLLMRTGGGPWSVPPGDGRVSPVGPRGNRHGDPARCALAASAHSCGQTVHWEAGARLVQMR